MLHLNLFNAKIIGIGRERRLAFEGTDQSPYSGPTGSLEAGGYQSPDDPSAREAFRSWNEPFDYETGLQATAATKDGIADARKSALSAGIDIDTGVDTPVDHLEIGDRIIVDGEKFNEAYKHYSIDEDGLKVEPHRAPFEASPLLPPGSNIMTVTGVEFHETPESGEHRVIILECGNGTYPISERLLSSSDSIIWDLSSPEALMSALESQASVLNESKASLKHFRGADRIGSAAKHFLNNFYSFIQLFSKNITSMIDRSESESVRDYFDNGVEAIDEVLALYGADINQYAQSDPNVELRLKQCATALDLLRKVYKD